MANGRTEPLTVTRRIDASASDIFAILVDPRRHVDLDGSGMLREAVSDGVVSAVGDVFVMRMYYSELGDYEMNNHVVEYEPNRRLTWEPEAGRRHPDEHAPDARWGQRWGFDLAPDGPEATIVTQTYDCSALPENERVSMDGGRIWIEAMTRTLEHLDELVAGRRTSTNPA
ncbi:polyketide cyclase [Actinopolymorpha pittospori]|uniref:Uncharacterized protein YndB with AHSA1/START domain n=1 Tax=Actinopolymorpha pittospori TaxID=648752 RepID=A0A927N8E0_9ACTN|nr:polyketide cyclase [Actinopolymorpha pittospori]MBE1612893.1 uncharacterized protein YndB with AHSA1/START domain [Actinopolymorpha pittospori]